MAELTVVSVSAPTDVRGGGAFAVNVTVTAAREEFENGVVYTLNLYVFGAQAAPGNVAGFLGGAPSVQNGSMNTPGNPWGAISATIPFPLIANPAPDLYTVTAALFLGPGQIFQSAVSAPNPVVVH